MTFRKEKRSNETRESLTDPEARLFKKSREAEARPGYLAHLLTDNRYGLVLNVCGTQASGTAERDAAAEMLAQAWKKATVGADRGYDTSIREEMRKMNFDTACGTEHFEPAIDARTTRHEGYAVSQCRHKRLEEIFGCQHSGATAQDAIPRRRANGVGYARYRSLHSGPGEDTSKSRPRRIASVQWQSKAASDTR